MGEVKRTKPERFYEDEWWPLEVAITWVATGNHALCQKVANLIKQRRSHPRGKHPTLATWLMGPQGIAASYEATPGAIYRKPIRGGWRPGGAGPHPLERAIAETAKILRGTRQNMSRTNIRIRRLAKGSPGAGSGDADWILAGTWASATIVDDRKLGVVLQEDEAHDAVVWRHINALAEPFKGWGIDRGRPTISQRVPDPSDATKKKTKESKRIQKKREQHEVSMGRAPTNPRGRPKGSKNVRH